MRIINIYGKNYKTQSPNIRIMSRAVILLGGKILLSHEVKTGKWLTPGGRVETDESLYDACIREAGEETGFKVKPKTDRPILSVREYYESNTFITNYFICDIIGTCEAMLTPYELEVQNEAVWVEASDAVNIFSDHNEYKHTDEFRYGHHFREYSALCMTLQTELYKK